MNSRIPENPAVLMISVYRHIMPRVRKHLDHWRREAAAIKNKELRQQALASIDSKAFHCYGGAVYAFLAGDQFDDAIEFIVAYQTISDYLDNLCDRSTSLNPDDFAMLHRSMKEALTPDSPLSDWYSLREDRENSYLQSLVNTCREILVRAAPQKNVLEHLHRLNDLYCSLQIHKHVRLDERLKRLKSWHASDCSDDSLYWQEFAAASGSTLGIFCLVAYSFSWDGKLPFADRIIKAYFPAIQGLHIMLDYCIDEREDEEEGDLNFCTFYESEHELANRVARMIQAGREQSALLPNSKFHAMVVQGLTGLYLSDPKMKQHRPALKKRLMKTAGPWALFFYWNSKIYCDLVQKVR